MIEVGTRFVNISSIFENLFFILELKREVLADCCKMSSSNGILMIFGANERSFLEAQFSVLILVFWFVQGGENYR